MNVPSVAGTWTLVSVDGTAISPGKVGVTFNNDGTFVASVDCNNARGQYSLVGSTLSFTAWEVTERGCLPPLPNEELVESALRGDGYAIAFSSDSELRLSGPHALVFRR